SGELHPEHDLDVERVVGVVAEADREAVGPAARGGVAGDRAEAHIDGVGCERRRGEAGGRDDQTGQRGRREAVEHPTGGHDYLSWGSVQARATVRKPFTPRQPTCGGMVDLTGQVTVIPCTSGCATATTAWRRSTPTNWAVNWPASRWTVPCFDAWLSW